ncbi:MAG TPA: T9SS type A sorting domain-containing protein [Bacteroidota bacterium]|nr:T9SS type A sorting domain-containing protein [Bacteroidota bacterium]
MKTLAALVVFMCALTFLGSPARGQITITTADVDSTLAVGHSLVNNIDKTTLTLNVGGHGSTTWDFSALHTDSTMTLTSVAVSGTPYASSFPGATHAFQSSFIYVLSGNSHPATAYVYFQRATNLLNMGEVGAFSDAPITLVSNNVPFAIFYGLPSTYGSSWTTAYLDTSEVFVGTFLFQSSGARHNSGFVVDAYGPMKLPDLTVHDALRIKKSDTTTGGVTVSYLFLARDGASVQATALNPTQADTGAVPIQPVSASWNSQVYALPIQLSSFTAGPSGTGAGVLLRWKTLSEVNNYGFDVERAAGSAGDFASLPGAFIPGHGTTTVPCDYAYTDVSAVPGTWYYRLRQMDLDGSFHYTDPARIDVKMARTPGDVPALFSLGQNFPNPFNPETTIRYGLPEDSPVELAVYNLLGERVALLVDGVQDAGFHDVRFDASRLASGVYFYRLQARGFVQTRKLSLLK